MISKPLAPLSQIALALTSWPLAWRACAGRVVRALAAGVSVMVLGLAGAQAQTAIETSQAGANARIDVLGSPFSPPPGTAASQSRILVYRASDSAGLKGATGVFVNGQYHTSLVAGGYSQLCTEPGAVEIGARQVRVGRTAKDNYDSLTATRLLAAQSQYFAVYEDAGRPVLKPVPAAQALQEMASVRLQMHTVSRVTKAQDCLSAPASAPAPVAAPVMVPAMPQQFALSGDALFAFGRSDAAGMTSQGLAVIDQLVSRIRNDYTYINHIHVIGHADPLGSPAGNQRLSAERADTVRRYIERVSQISARITSEGRGSRQLVERSCGSVASASAIACNQPNRRVVVEVVGQRRVDGGGK